MIEKTIAHFEQLKIKQMVCYCGSCYNLLSKTMPAVYGKKLPFALISMFQWILQKADSGQISVVYPSDKHVAIHESCYVSELEKDFADTIHRLYSHIGMKTEKMEHCGENNLSCGMASAARDLNIFKSVLPAQWRRFQEARTTKTGYIAMNCPGCYLSMAMTAPFLGLKLLNMTEEILHAFGDTIQKPLSGRLFSIISSFIQRSPYLISQFDTSCWN